MASDLATQIKDWQKAARDYAAANGHIGNHGGWISSTKSGRSLCQGWDSYRLKFARQIKDHVTCRVTAFDTFAELTNTRWLTNHDARRVRYDVMTSKRHVRERECGQKRQFDTLDEARRMAWFQRKRSGERWSAYRCKWCGFVHIGHGR